jgi:hypothetical protein
MKHLKTFENETERNYVIITYIENRLVISAKFKEYDPAHIEYPFQFLDNFPPNSFVIKYYTKEEALYDMPQIENYYNSKNSYHKFEVILKDDLDILINSQKYNL